MQGYWFVVVAHEIDDLGDTRPGTYPRRWLSTSITLTMNPAIDMAARTDHVVPIDKMRCESPRFEPGCGINIARTIILLGGASPALFPPGSPTGVVLDQLVRDAGVPTHHVEVAERLS